MGIYYLNDNQPNSQASSRNTNPTQADIHKCSMTEAGIGTPKLYMLYLVALWRLPIKIFLIVIKKSAIFYTKLIMHGYGLPFEIKIPNDETLTAMSEAEQLNGDFVSIDDFV